MCKIIFLTAIFALFIEIDGIFKFGNYTLKFENNSTTQVPTNLNQKEILKGTTVLSGKL